MCSQVVIISPIVSEDKFLDVGVLGQMDACFLYLLVYLFEREGGRERDTPAAASLPGCSQQPGLGQADSLLAAPVGGRGPNPWAVIQLS